MPVHRAGEPAPLLKRARNLREDTMGL